MLPVYREKPTCARCGTRIYEENGNWWCYNPECLECPHCGTWDHRDGEEITCGDCDFVGPCDAFQKHKDECPAWRKEDTKS